LKLFSELISFKALIINIIRKIIYTNSPIAKGILPKRNLKPDAPYLNKPCV